MPVKEIYCLHSLKTGTFKRLKNKPAAVVVDNKETRIPIIKPKRQQ